MGKMAWPRWALLAALVIVVALVVIVLAAPRPVSVTLAPVGVGPITDSVADQGYARVREAYVVSAPVSGRLQRLDLHVGDRVEKGSTLIARILPSGAELLDPRTRAQAEARVAVATAAVASARAQLEQSAAGARQLEGDLARQRELAAKGFAAAQALEAVEAKARAARAGVRAAQADLNVRRSELGVARAALIGPEGEGQGAVSVSAPASGYVTRVLQESERTVAVGAPLVEVSDKGGLEAAIEFLSQDAVKIREGMAAEVFDWGGPALPAVVRRVEPQGFTKVSALGVEEQRVLVFLQMSGDPTAWASLGPGYRLWGRVFLRREPRALKVALGALVRQGGGWAVFKADAGRARLTPVDVGVMTDREAEILKGLRAQDQVVVFPSDQIRDGVRLKRRAN
ncbi:efflux RND transporter periplasmic adaptor subunit [Caulobacter sp.]|uniref:efflux RND transporter periplasmic adaptor subunit n=1 Tax=Caulobacter sp. TaxID=78 RepID=UPI002B4965C5|nr:HlyD family efflux transporter periplasmic adaptor subunit [Caulobacter sp.]HJV43079.1 HlyD family efflux transporter periplasmic adaptor subunit [Caulobacter sp.]